MYLYRTVYERAQSEQTIERSRFITNVTSVNSYDEARQFVSDIKTRYRDATHNVPAVVIGNKQEIQWTNDDGEPHGTAGSPALRLLVEKELTNVALVVTRYFGGIKLGTGGLTRAYAGSAKLGVESAGICEVWNGFVMEYIADYTFLNRIQDFTRKMNIRIVNISYSERVSISFELEEGLHDMIKSTMDDISSGSCKLVSEKKSLIRKKIC